jgi:tRNA-uridine 2-sulfurtransferase
MSTLRYRFSPPRWIEPGRPRWPARDHGSSADERLREEQTLMRVLVAMSGGVDSSVAAARMVDAGHDVVGVHLALSSAPGTLRTGSRGCCSKEDASDARRVADILDIPFYVWDFADRFAEDVIDEFVSSYARGETPNPCVRCNERIKFSALSARALALGFDALATGHYARLADGRLRRAVDPDKDQSYVLGVLSAEQLRHAVFPIGDTPKPQIREEAARRGLAVADKPDSHDICFIPSGDTQAFLGARIGVRRGAVVDSSGTVLAEHDGVHEFTVGQRKGLGIAGPGPDGGPRYVVAIDAETATVRVGAAADLDVWALTGERPVFTSGTAPRVPVECEVQVRAHGGIAAAVAELRDGVLVAELRSPLRGVAPGQTMVLYAPDPDGDEVIASATISAAASG